MEADKHLLQDKKKKIDEKVKKETTKKKKVSFSLEMIRTKVMYYEDLICSHVLEVYVVFEHEAREYQFI